MKEEMELVEQINIDVIKYISFHMDISGVNNLDELLEGYKNSPTDIQIRIVFWFNDFGFKYYDKYHPVQQDVLNRFLEALEDLDSDWEPEEEDIDQLIEDYWFDEEEDERSDVEMD